MNIIVNFRKLSPVKLIVFSFLASIVIGTCLLHLPFSYKGEVAPSFIDTLFISTSSVCVTGLSMFDTWSQWTFFGQLIMMILIQIGGLGLVSFTTGFTLLLKRKLNIRNLQLAQQYTSGNLIDIPKLLKTILFFSLSCELIGASLLAIRFIPQFGVYGAWISIFTAVSAYCNAGFDLLGFLSPFGSLYSYYNDALVSLVVASLVIIGGIGFIVVVDIYSCSVKKIKDVNKHAPLSIQSKIVLQLTCILLVIGTVLFFTFEYNNTLKSMSFFEKLNVSFFQSTVARTAGFSTVYIGEESDIMKLFTIILMFIGAAPSSTAGGIKVTTFTILICTVLSVLKGNEDTLIKHHRIDKLTVYKAISVISLSLLAVFACTCVLEIAEAPKHLSTIDILFEVVSAFGTVGLSAGITGFLTDISKISLIFLMFFGRVGPISLVYALTIKHSHRKNSILPEGKIIVG